MKTSNKGISLIKYFEGLHDGDLKKIGLQPKPCPANVWTIGWGYALVNKKTGKFLKGQGDYKLIAEQYPEYLNMTIEQADKLLDIALIKYEGIVNKRLKVSVNQNQYDALVSHTYNTGGSDTLFNLVNAGKLTDAQKWIRERYITAEGKVKAGLVRRRKEESILFMTP